MHLNWLTLALQTVNFAILVWLLQRFLYRPVLRMMDVRRAAIEQQFSAAASAESAAHQQLAALQAQRAGIDSERAATLRAAAAEADKLRAERRAQAEREATELLQDARRHLAAERREALQAMQREALELGSGIAARLLAEAPEPLRATAWLERIERHLRELGPEGRGELLRGVPGRLPVTVVTAIPLSAEACEQWRRRLTGALAAEAAAPGQSQPGESGSGESKFAFSSDPRLIAGAELRFGDNRLRFSLQSAVESLRSELEQHADAV